jgi:hypothetical protein
MKIYLLLILFSVTSISLSQKNADGPINCGAQIKNGKKENKYYDKNTNCYYIIKGKVFNYVPEGLWKKYKCDTLHPYLIGNYHNGKPYRTYSKFNDRKIIEKGSWINKNYADSLTRYYPNGTASFKAFFKDSSTTNYSGSYYNSEGKLELSYVVENGKVVKEKIVQSKKDNLIPYNYLNTNDTIYIYPSSLLEKHIPFDMNDLNRFKKNNYSDEQFIYYNKNHDPFLIGWIDENNQFNGKKFIYSIEGYLLEIKFYVNGFLFSSDINLNQVEKVPSENFNLSSKKKNKS